MPPVPRKTDEKTVEKLDEPVEYAIRVDANGVLIEDPNEK